MRFFRVGAMLLFLVCDDRRTNKLLYNMRVAAERMAPHEKCIPFYSMSIMLLCAEYAFIAAVTALNMVILWKSLNATKYKHVRRIILLYHRVALLSRDQLLESQSGSLLVVIITTTAGSHLGLSDFPAAEFSIYSKNKLIKIIIMRLRRDSARHLR